MGRQFCGNVPPPQHYDVCLLLSLRQLLQLEHSIDDVGQRRYSFLCFSICLNSRSFPGSPHFRSLDRFLDFFWSDKTYLIDFLGVEDRGEFVFEPFSLDVVFIDVDITLLFQGVCQCNVLFLLLKVFLALRLKSVGYPHVVSVLGSLGSCSGSVLLNIVLDVSKIKI